MGSTWKVILAFAVVFACGGACGWVLTLRYCSPPAPLRMPGMGRPQDFGAMLLMRWVRANQLELTPAQRESIRPIVTDAAEKLHRLRREDQHSAALIIEKMQDSVAAELTPAQRAHFEELILRQRQRINRFLQRQAEERAWPKEEEPSPPAKPAPAPQAAAP